MGRSVCGREPWIVEIQFMVSFLYLTDETARRTAQMDTAVVAGAPVVGNKEGLCIHL